MKVTPPGGATLTTQLYFPGTAANDADGIYDPSLLLDDRRRTATRSWAATPS